MPHVHRHKYVGKTKKKNEEVLCETLENLSVTSDEESTKGLSDMPTDTLRLVIDELDFKERWILRKVSKPLRSLVDDTKFPWKSIHITLRTKFVLVRYNNYEVVYRRTNGNEKDVNVINGDKTLAFDHLESTLKDPNIQLQHFEFEQIDDRSSYFRRDDERWVERVYNDLERLLKSLNHQLSTNTFELRAIHPSNLLQILPYLKPGALQKIIIRRDGVLGFRWDIPESLEIIKEISETEQWKQAEEIELRYLVEFPMEYTTHFKRFSIHYTERRHNTLPKLGEFFSKLPHFERCLVESDDIYNVKYMQYNVGIKAPANELTEYVRHFSVPDSVDYLEFQFFDKSVLIEKKKALAV